MKMSKILVNWLEAHEIMLSTRVKMTMLVILETIFQHLDLVAYISWMSELGQIAKSLSGPIIFTGAIC